MCSSNFTSASRRRAGRSDRVSKRYGRFGITKTLDSVNIEAIIYWAVITCPVPSLSSLESYKNSMMKVRLKLWKTLHYSFKKHLLSYYYKTLFWASKIWVNNCHTVAIPIKITKIEIKASIDERISYIKYDNLIENKSAVTMEVGKCCKNIFKKYFQKLI